MFCQSLHHSWYPLGMSFVGSPLRNTTKRKDFEGDGFPCGDHPSKRFAPTYPFPYSCVAQVPTQHGSSSYQQQQQSYGSFPPTYHREQPPSQYESQGFAEDQPPTLQDASDDYRTHYEHLESESNHRLKRTRTWTEHEPAPNATTAASIDTHFPHMQELSESIQSPPAETSGNAATDEHESDEDVVSIRMHPHFVIPSARHMPSLLPGSVVEEMFVNTMSEDQLMCSRQKTSRTSALQIVLYRPPTLPLPSAVTTQESSSDDDTDTVELYSEGMDAMNTS